MKLFALLTPLTLVLFACATPDIGPPPCSPLVEGGADPCDSDISEITTFHGTAWWGEEPWPIREVLDGDGFFVSHFAVRGSYASNSVRCENKTVHRFAKYHTTHESDVGTGLGVLTCYADIQVVDYLVGSGSTNLTAVVAKIFYAGQQDASAEVIEGELRYAERALIQGGYHPRIKNIPAGGITGVESVFFIGPGLDVSVESWEVFETWDVERRTDGTVVAVHPARSVFINEPNYETAFKPKIELTLPTLKRKVRTEHAAWIADTDGHVEEDPDTPMVLTNTANLHQYYVEAAATTHPSGPPSLPPPACGLAVSDYLNNVGPVRDCETLLGAKDALRGTGALNWSVDVSIAEWDGVTVAGAPQRVRRLELADRSLSGSIPASLARLELTTLRLSGNALEGCVPSALREVSEHDLDSLGLPDCAG